MLYNFWQVVGTGMRYPSVIHDGHTVGWYIANDLTNIVKDGSDFVSAWRDKLGSGRDLLQAVGADQPKWFLNDGVKFDGITDFMKTPAFTFIQPEMIYIAFKQIVWNSGARRIFDGDGLSSGFAFQAVASPGLAVSAGIISSASYDLLVNVFGIMRVLFDGVNSKLIINNNTPITGDFGSLDMDGFTLGSVALGYTNSNIQVKEVLLRDVADTTQNEQAIYDYLSNKYSI